MIVLKSRLFPIGKFAAINLFGIVLFKRKSFERKSAQSIIRLLRHEAIHTEQMKELLFIGFYIIYVLEWLYRLVFHTKTAYKGLSFEVEAYSNQDNLGYLTKRKHFAQWRRKV